METFRFEHLNLAHLHVALLYVSYWCHWYGYGAAAAAGASARDCLGDLATWLRAGEDTLPLAGAQIDVGGKDCYECGRLCTNMTITVIDSKQMKSKGFALFVWMFAMESLPWYPISRGYRH